VGGWVEGSPKDHQEIPAHTSAELELEGGSGAGVIGVGVMGCSHSQSVVPSYSSGIVTTGSLSTYPDYALDENQAVSRTQFFFFFFLVYTPFPGGSLRL